MRASIQPPLVLALLAATAHSLPYFPEHEAYNLNQNKTATTPLDYWGEWQNHQFHPSPDNWRMPFYSLFLDRFVNGDPSNDNSNGTVFEVDMFSTQLRVGGDISGLVDTLDYLQGMGIKVRFRSTLDAHHSDGRLAGTLHFRKSLHQPAVVGRLFQSLGPDTPGSPLWHHRRMAPSGCRDPPTGHVRRLGKHHVHHGGPPGLRGLSQYHHSIQLHRAQRDLEIVAAVLGFPSRRRFRQLLVPTILERGWSAHWRRRDVSDDELPDERFRPGWSSSSASLSRHCTEPPLLTHSSTAMSSPLAYTPSGRNSFPSLASSKTA